MVQIDDRELVKLIADTKLADRVAVQYAKDTTKAVSFAVEKRIKIEMPVRTGRARASWGHWTPGQLRQAGREAGDASSSDAVWVSADGGLTITQGSNVGYIEQLNAGHSRQAPAGFIDRAEMFGQLMLEEELGLIDPLSPAYQSRLFLAKFG